MKRGTRFLNALAFVAVFSRSQVASAHLPIFDDGTAVDAEHALVISDIGLSQVVYHEVKEPVHPLWIAFDGVAGQELYFNPGVPAIDRLKEYRPAFALVGPGLPEATLPFAIPDGAGAELCLTTDITDPEFFHEPFSGTDSWILFKKTVILPKSGRYYLVGYVPSGQPGKYWMAIGKREEFGADAIAALPQDIAKVRAFHESSATTSPCFLIPMGFVGALLSVPLVVRRQSATDLGRHAQKSKAAPESCHESQRRTP